MVKRCLVMVSILAVAVACCVAFCVVWFAPNTTVAERYPLVPSSVDFDQDGIDDFSDLRDGARADAVVAPIYDDGYYEDGFPPDDRGACTDTVWRAFSEAGYDLKAMVDIDIARDGAAYVEVAPNPDPNIDFRRVRVLDVFFSRYAQSLTCNVAGYEAWQAGDIVVFDNGRHIGVVSDRRDSRGTPFVIHNMGQLFREEDYLAYPFAMRPTSHYRFDASLMPQQVLIAWKADVS